MPPTPRKFILVAEVELVPRSESGVATIHGAISWLHNALREQLEAENTRLKLVSYETENTPTRYLSGLSTSSNNKVLDSLSKAVNETDCVRAGYIAITDLEELMERLQQQ